MLESYGNHFTASIRIMPKFILRLFYTILGLDVVLVMLAHSLQCLAAAVYQIPYHRHAIGTDTCLPCHGKLRSQNTLRPLINNS